jgi:sugar lactone lactonase YvrE
MRSTVRRGVLARAARSRVAVVSAALTAGVAALLGTAPPALATAGTITTIAGGTGWGPALSVGQRPVAVAMTSSKIWLIDATIFSPDDSTAYALRSIDRATGVESAPLLGFPDEFAFHPVDPTLATDSAGNLFIAYNGNAGGVVEELTTAGKLKPIAGGGTLNHVDHVSATSEALNTLNGIAVSNADVVYVSENVWQDGRFDTTNTDSRVRKINGGTITTLAGLGQPGFRGDGGKALLAELNAPLGLAVGPAGSVYIADSGNQRIRRVTTDGVISTFAGGGTSTAEGVAPKSAFIEFPRALAYDSKGLLYTDPVYQRCRIRRIVGNSVNTVIGTGSCAAAGDEGPAGSATTAPADTIAALGSDIVFAELGDTGYGPALRTIDGNGIVHRVAGIPSGSYGGDGGPALQAQLGYGPHVAVDAAGNTYVAADRVLRRISPSGVISTLSTADTLDVVVSPAGDVYTSDDNVIRRVAPDGSTTLVAGSGTQPGPSADGTPATQAYIASVRGMAFDARGDLVFATGCLIRDIDPAGILHTVAGDASSPCRTDSGDGGPATSAGVGLTTAVATDAAGDIYFGDTDLSDSNQVQRIRRVDPAGIITTIAGGGTSAADGVPATQATIAVDALAVDAAGDVLVAEKVPGLVRSVRPDGTIATIAGGGTGADGGPAVSATVSGPDSLAVRPTGDLLIGCNDARTPFAGQGVVREVSAG